ncbi:unnamed protein product [Haemonchus placei]|uniref:Col_cuticle_N domain-containing protein n=1 Tax=Haemonchus placei TaxID=6290 RepID=A0A0N4VTH7_HAEPC|nr:unnamed protein product [Haemonchus placei]
MYTKLLYAVLSVTGLICLGAIMSYVRLILEIDQFRDDLLRSSDEYKVLSSRVWGEIVMESGKAARVKRSQPVFADFDCPAGRPGPPGEPGLPGGEPAFDFFFVFTTLLEISLATKPTGRNHAFLPVTDRGILIRSVGGLTF